MMFQTHLGTDSLRVEEVTVEQAKELFHLWLAARRPEGVVRLGFTTFQVDAEGNYMLLLSVTQKCSLSLDPRDARNNPAPLDGAPQWSSSDTTVATVTPSADGLTAVVAAAGITGTAQINVTADARVGPETVPLNGVLDVTVAAGEAVTLGIQTGAPEEQ